MSTQARIGAAILAIVVIVASFIIVNGISDSDDPPTTPITQTESTGGATVEATTTTEAVPVDTVVVQNGQPVGGVETLSFTKGDRIEFKVESDAADHVHVHGYDIERPVAAGGSVSFSFDATIEGIFEVELHGSETEILKLEVTP